MFWTGIRTDLHDIETQKKEEREKRGKRFEISLQNNINERLESLKIRINR